MITRLRHLNKLLINKFKIKRTYKPEDFQVLVEDHRPFIIVIGHRYRILIRQLKCYSNENIEWYSYLFFNEINFYIKIMLPLTGRPYRPCPFWGARRRECLARHHHLQLSLDSIAYSIPRHFWLLAEYVWGQYESSYYL